MIRSVITGVLCSNESHKWIDEENYEIKGFVVNGENWITEAPHKGRDNSDNLVMSLNINVSTITL